MSQSLDTPSTPQDSALMLRALELAREGLYRTSPNPRVGCVIATSAGEILGQGSTQVAGGAHAEVMALRSAAAQGRSVVGATAYVTLEPCSHHGRTGPCCDALVDAGVARVVAAMPDPNPLVQGRGFARLRAAGIDVLVGVESAAAKELNLGFLSRMVRARPWVRLKVAASMDGFTALATGQSQWITSQAARADGHSWRARACALLTGIGTVLADNPRLDVRGVETPRQPAVVVLDSTLRTPHNAALFEAQRAVHIYTAEAEPVHSKAAYPSRVRIVAIPRVDLREVLHDLAQQGVNELHIEAGATLNGAFVRAGLVDEFLVYLAPKLLGSGHGMWNDVSLGALSEATPLSFLETQRVGDDLRILARIQGRDGFF